MKFLVVLCVVVACAVGDVSHVVKDEVYAPIVKQSYDISPEGAFQYAYETGNGIYAQAQGELQKGQSEYPYVAIKGAFRYGSPEGVPIELSYQADENGYQAQGAHLPTPPPIPQAIVRSLEYLAAHPPPPPPKSL